MSALFDTVKFPFSPRLSDGTNSEKMAHHSCPCWPSNSVSTGCIFCFGSSLYL